MKEMRLVVGKAAPCFLFLIEDAELKLAEIKRTLMQ
jgi:hypothetical protein